MGKTFKMKLDESPFDATKAGSKTIEVRLNDERRREIKVGDKIEFYKTTNEELLKVLVLNIRQYNSLLELTQKEEFSRTGGIYKNVKEWIESINNYYSKDEQSHYGLLVFEVSC